MGQWGKIVLSNFIMFDVIQKNYRGVNWCSTDHNPTLCADLAWHGLELGYVRASSRRPARSSWDLLYKHGQLTGLVDRIDVVAPQP